MKSGNERAGGDSNSRTGSEAANLRRTDHSTTTGYLRKWQPGPLRLLEAEAASLEAGAAVLARSSFTNAGPAVEQLGKALEVLCRREAERTRHKLRNGRSLAALFHDEESAT